MYQALTGVLHQWLEMKLAATADGIARLKAVSRQTFPLVDTASPLMSQFKQKGEVHSLAAAKVACSSIAMTLKPVTACIKDLVALLKRDMSDNI